MPSNTSTNLAEQFHKILAQPWLPKIVNVTLIIFLLWLAYSYAEQFIYPQPESDNPTAITTEPVSAPQQNKTDPTEIAHWHLFGLSGKQNTAPASVINAPETKLKLTLRGIVAENDKHRGFAIIQKPDNKEKHFSINDSIFGLATLKEIYTDRVIILRKGTYETLTLSKEAPLFEILTDKTKKGAKKRTISTWHKALLDRKLEKYNLTGVGKET